MAARVVIDDIVVDASLNERHSSSVELTKHPVESGVSPADHARELPDRLLVEGIFTNTGLNATDQAQRGGSSKPGEAGHAQAQADKLRQLKTSRAAVAISTPFREYTDMVLVALEFPRDARVGDAVRFSATFEQIRFVTTESVKLEAVPKDVTKATKKKEQPKKVPEQAAETPKVDSSWAYTIGQAGGIVP